MTMTHQGRIHLQSRSINEVNNRRDDFTELWPNPSIVITLLSFQHLLQLVENLGIKI